MQATLIFPHQLFKDHPAIQKGQKIYLIEDELFFSQYKFHKQKLLLHRASMQAYQDRLENRGYAAEYLDCKAYPNLEKVFEQLSKNRVKAINIVDPTDNWLEKRIKRLAAKYEMGINWQENPNFLTNKTDLKELLGKRYFMNPFYIKQRQRLNILVDTEGNPEGGKWNFDHDNRKKLPKKVSLPPIYEPKENKWVTAAKNQIAIDFEAHYGETDAFCYAVTHEEAEKCLDDFLKYRMPLFGDYEDAISQRGAFLFHSVLTPYLNIGLLQPDQIVDRALEFHEKYNYPLNSLEGFIRQIIGWREYMRGIYELEGVKERTTNYWGFSRKIPESFWEGTTGLPPVDLTIEKLKKHAYAHHIERLMVLGNIMLLCEFDPNEVYRWFMEWFIDAYDWVMVPNVYGMSQYADGGLICTKPYLSSSNYIRKMSDFKKGDWSVTWDGLYWRFIHTHRETFAGNYRMAMMVKMWDKMDVGKQQAHLQAAESFLSNLKI
jgi:deoxyribodipyrimidine photolyase-related protein